MIPYGQHCLDDEDIDAVVEVLKNGPITQGNKVDEYELAVAQYSGSEYGVAVSNGTAALHLAVKSLGIGPGDEVITTPLTFCATANVVVHAGADIKFVDVEEKSLNIDPARIEEKITQRTKAIIPVDFRGHPAPLPEIKLIAERYNIQIIEDASHSIGSTYEDREKIFSCGDCAHVDLATFSFHPVKHITTGEGGVVLTNSSELAKKLVSLRAHGLNRTPDMFNEKKRIGPWIYDVDELGYNYRLTDIQAALGLSQLKKIEKFKARRRQIVDYYNEELKGIDELILPFEKENVDSNFHIYVLQIRANQRFDRYDFFLALQKNGYQPMVHYLPVHLLTFYRKTYGFKRGDYPIAEQYYDRAITIPLYPMLSDELITKIVSDIKRIVKTI